MYNRQLGVAGKLVSDINKLSDNYSKMLTVRPYDPPLNLLEIIRNKKMAKQQVLNILMRRNEIV